MCHMVSDDGGRLPGHRGGVYAERRDAVSGSRPPLRSHHPQNQGEHGAASCELSSMDLQVSVVSVTQLFSLQQLPKKRLIMTEGKFVTALITA